MSGSSKDESTEVPVNVSGVMSSESMKRALKYML